MNNEQYLKESARTVAGGKLHDLGLDSLMELAALSGLISLADTFKAGLFYGTPLVDTTTKHRELLELQQSGIKEDTKINEDYNDVLHAALGIASEGQEILYEYINATKEERELNRTNLIEEAGDVLWYVALLLRKLDVSFEEVMDKNIAKLKVRFPDKFTEEAARNRDLQAEEKALN